MSFGPESSNPRLRRAYADTMLAKATRSGASADLRAAEQAISSVGDTRKAQAANFPQRLASAALKDVATQTIVDAARKTLSQSETPRCKLTWVGTLERPYDLVATRRYSSDFSLTELRGASMGRTEVVDPATGELANFTELTATDLEGDRMPHRIPTNAEGEVSVMATRALPDAVRTSLSKIVSKIG
jgi:hypothetical protein